MVPLIVAAGEAVAGVAGAVCCAEGAAIAGAGAAAFVARQVAVTAGRAAAVAGAGVAVAPWVVGGLTIYQLGKLGYKLLEGNDKK